jgi:xanthine phosphoribosyltransferase
MPQFRDDVVNQAVTWIDVHRDTKKLARLLMDKGPWKGIVALTRGGLVPAAIIARELSIYKVDTLCITSYDEQVQGKVTVLKAPAEAMADRGAGWLMVDDLVDTGATAREARQMLPDAHFATVYAKPKGRGCVDTCVADIPQETWIFFPWDTDPEPQYVVPLAHDKRS